MKVIAKEFFRPPVSLSLLGLNIFPITLLRSKLYIRQSYVYWTVHHLDSWVKRDQLDATCFIITLFSAQHVSDVNKSILRSLWLIRWVTSWVLSGSMCVGVPLQCGYGGVVSVCRLQPAYGYHTTTAKPQRNTNTHQTRYNPWSNSTN